MLYGTMCFVLLQLTSAMSAASMTATTASATVTLAVLTQAVLPKAATASGTCWHHNATVGAVYSPAWA